MIEFASKLQDLGDRLLDKLPDLVIALLVGLALVELAILALGYALKVARIPRALKPILYTLARAFLWVVLLLVIIQTLGLNDLLLAVTGSSVVLALVLSTGVAPLISDTLAGLSLAADRNFQPGAKVQVGEKGTVGHVLSMDIRKTRIETSDGKVHVIPNSVIDKTEWVVLEPKGSKPRRKSILKRK
ncbi:MAG TPA: mechanosensitive ion channel domain-containing protein [Patescibacteria group bacterium]|jgi:small-conductance mechanosensitive channel